MLLESIKNTIQKFNIKNVLIGFSGGVDSTVLAYCLSKIENLNVRAVYVNHGVSNNAKDWERFCKQFCLDNNIEFHSKTVDCSNLQGDSFEAVAREKRYDVYKSLLQDNEYLCLGQHSDDQVETVLLQLFRGTGLSGLSGMPLCSKFHNGYILRPFLDNDIMTISKSVIEEFSNKNNIEHIFDESNDSNKYRRNFLRNEIIPQIEKEFGKIDKAIMRTASNCAEAQEYIESKSLDIKENKFSVEEISTLSLFEIKNSIQKWIKNNGFQSLSSNKLKELIKFIENYKSDSDFKIDTKKYEIRHFKKFIYILDKNKKHLDVSSIKLENKETVIHKKDINKNFLYKNKIFSLKKYFRENNVPVWEREYFYFVVQNNNILKICNLY